MTPAVSRRWSGLGRDFDQNGTGTSGAHLSECFEHGARDFPRFGRLAPPLGHGAHHAGLVEDFVDGPEVLADCPHGDLAGNQEHR